MKSFLFLCSLLITLTNTVSASAATDPSKLNAIRLLEIKAEYYPGETYYLGYAENPDHSINSVFYENNEKVRKFFSFKDLSREIPIIQTTSGGTVYDLVRISVVSSKIKGKYNVSMSYMRNGLFKNRRSSEFTIVYNARRQVYELKDADGEELINRSYVTTNYWGSLAVGIANIQSSK